TTISGDYDVGEAEMHPLISGDYDLRFFENRTVGVNPRAQELVDKVREALHAVKKRVQMLPGDFIGVRNNYSVHGKEIGQLAKPEEAWSRWILKTVNVNSIAPHRKHLVPGTDYLIAG